MNCQNISFLKLISLRSLYLSFLKIQIVKVIHIKPTYFALNIKKIDYGKIRE